MTRIYLVRLLAAFRPVSLMLKIIIRYSVQNLRRMGVKSKEQVSFIRYSYLCNCRKGLYGNCQNFISTIWGDPNDFGDRATKGLNIGQTHTNVSKTKDCNFPNFLFVFFLMKLLPSYSAIAQSLCIWEGLAKTVI